MERERPRPPARTGRTPRAVREEKPAAPRATESPERPRDPDPSLWMPAEYDHVVDYRESLASDFDAVAAEHPRSAALGAFLLGAAVGIVLASAFTRGR